MHNKTTDTKRERETEYMKMHRAEVNGDHNNKSDH